MKRSIKRYGAAESFKNHPDLITRVSLAKVKNTFRCIEAETQVVMILNLVFKRPAIASCDTGQFNKITDKEKTV